MPQRQNRATKPLALTVILIIALASHGIATAVTPASSTQTNHEIQAPTELTSCTTITESGRYVLTQDIENTSEDICIDIQTSDVVLDGNGHTVDGFQNTSTISAFSNSTNQTGTHPGMPEWRNIGIAADTSEPLSNITVQQLTVTDWIFGVYYNNVTQGEITEVTITNSGDGLSLYDTNAVTVSQSNLSANLAGLVGDGANATEIHNNSITTNEFDGVAFYNTIRNQTGFVGDAGTVRENVIRDNTVSDNGWDGIFVVSGRNNTIAENTVVNNSLNGIVLVASTATEVRDNQVTRNEIAGILTVFQSDNNTLRGNYLDANGHTGIGLLDQANSNRVVDNIIVNTTGTSSVSAQEGYAAGIAIDNATGNVIQNTTMRNNTNWTYYAVNTTANNIVEDLTIEETVTVSFTGTDIALTRHDQSEEKGRNVTETRVQAGLVLANTSSTASLTNLSVEWLPPTRETQEVLDPAAVQALVVEVPGLGQVGPPTDPDDDGLYEDVTGDERVTIEDVAALAALTVADQTLGLQLSPEQAAAFDLTGDGQFNEADVIALISEMPSRQAT